MRATGAALLVAAIAIVLAAIDPSFFVRDDFQLQYLPGSRDVARAWSSGTVPLLSPYSWFGGALAAEYQHGVFSIFRALLDVLVWLLPLSLTARGAMLFIVHAAVAAAGAFLLARSYGVRPPLATMVAVIAALNGWILWWGTTWFPGIAGFAWLPWYWVALRRGRWIGAAVALYLLVAAGWPYAVAMAAMVAALNVLTSASWRTALKMILSSALGLCLAAPAILTLLEYYAATARSSMSDLFESVWVVPARALLGLIAPAFTTTWPVFGQNVPHPAVEMAGATVPLLAVFALLVARRRDARRLAPELTLLAVLLVLMLLPSPGPFRWSFRWLPLFHLTLAIAGAVALENVRRAWQWTSTGVTIAIIAVTFIGFSRHSDVPVWRYDESLLSPAPLDPSRRYLALYSLSDVAVGARGKNIELRPGNVPMLAGVEFLNGYSPMSLAGLKNLFLFEAHGPINAARAEHLLTRDQLLLHLGVDGLIVPKTFARPPGWSVAAEIANCVVLHRDARIGAPLFLTRDALQVATPQQAYAVLLASKSRRMPVVMLAPGEPRRVRYGARAIANLSADRLSTSFVVRGKGPKALVVFRRPWMPGWRATLNGEAIPVLRADMVMPAVEIPADAEGEMRIVYRPASVVVGASIAVAALLVMLGVSLWPCAAKT